MTGIQYIESLPVWQYLAHGEKHQGSIATIDGKIRMVRDSIKAKNPSNILEIGFNVGHSAAVILDNILSESKLTSLDIVQTSSAGVLEQMYPNFKFIRTSSVDFLSAYNGDKFDFAFIDGDHNPKVVKNEIELILPHLIDGAWILFDDTHIPGYGIGEMLNQFITTDSRLKEIGKWNALGTDYSNDYFHVPNFVWRPCCQRLFEVCLQGQ